MGYYISFFVSLSLPLSLSLSLSLVHIISNKRYSKIKSKIWSLILSRGKAMIKNVKLYTANHYDLCTASCRYPIVPGLILIRVFGWLLVLVQFLLGLIAAFSVPSACSRVYLDPVLPQVRLSETHHSIHRFFLQHLLIQNVLWVVQLLQCHFVLYKCISCNGCMYLFFVICLYLKAS